VTGGKSIELSSRVVENNTVGASSIQMPQDMI